MEGLNEINVIDIVENDDGSAIMTLEMSDQVKDQLVSYGLKHLLLQLLDERK